MSTTETGVFEEVATYVRTISRRESDVLARLRDETLRMPNGSLQVSPEQGQFMAMVVRLINARRTLEIGVFTGYSSLVIASALPDDGKVIACDVSEEYTSVARRYWRMAGVAHKIDLRLRPALETLDELLVSGNAGGFDFVFIDADKENNDRYYEAALTLVRRGGVVAVDNVFWHGRAMNESIQDLETVSIRAFNQKLHEDARVWLSVIPIGDGLALACKR